ncbi:MAG: hypothetical protein PHW64_03690 [Sulfuricurvum sp.]|nr:hypothetical protein [Sulfuricurvum sp.]
MSVFDYSQPADLIFSVRTEDEMKEFLTYMLASLNIIYENSEEKDFIPPIVFNERGNVFNVDYNFMIKCFANWLDTPVVEDHFLLVENGDKAMVKNGMLLVASWLEDNYELVRINHYSIDVSKFRNARKVEFKRKFYNVVVIKNGDNIRRFSAVPFSASALKKLLSVEEFELLDSIANQGNFIQIVFGMTQYMSYIKSGNGVPPPVIE